MFQKKRCREYQNPHVMFNFLFFGTSLRLCASVRRYGRAIQAADDSIMRRRNDAICMPNPKATDIHSQYIIRLYHGSSGCANASQYYVIRILPLFLRFACSYFGLQGRYMFCKSF